MLSTTITREPDTLFDLNVEHEQLTQEIADIDGVLPRLTTDVRLGIAKQEQLDILSQRRAKAADRIGQIDAQKQSIADGDAAKAARQKHEAKVAACKTFLEYAALRQQVDRAGAAYDEAQRNAPDLVIPIQELAAQIEWVRDELARLSNVIPK